MKREKIRRTLRHSPTLATRIADSRRMTDSGTIFVVESERVNNVILKLARGHAVFELNEPQYDKPVHIGWAPLLTLPDASRQRFERPPEGRFLQPWPEVGSRAMQRAALNCGLDDSSAPSPWLIVQPGRYRYFADLSGGVLIRLVISEYLAAEVLWP